MSRLICFAVAAVFAINVFALEVPGISKSEGRIRLATYDSEEVFLIKTVVGIASLIILEPGEQYLTHAFGDSGAWQLATKNNYIFIKPTADLADTNLIVVTDKRSYNFKLRYHNTRDAKAFYTVKFRYPDSEAKKKSTLANKNKIEKHFKNGDDTFNLNYTMSGDTQIAPINVWDDQTFTYFKFPGNRDLPTIYIINSDGSESLINEHASGASNNIIVMHRVSEEWVLRSNKLALGVYNESYDPIGKENKTGTKSNKVKRVTVSNEDG